MLGVTFIAFFLSHVAVPDAARAWAGVRASPQAVAALSSRYHLNDPIYIQYLYYMKGLVTGDWGISPSSGRPIFADIRFFFPSTVELALAAMLISVILGIPLGALAAVYNNRKIDHSIRVIYLGGFSSPPFFVALVVIFVFSYYFKLFPTQGELSNSLVPPTRVTGMYIIDSLITGNWVDLRDAVWHIIMPAIALALTYFGIVARIMRSSMLEVLQKDFVRASYAKGLSERKVIIRHAMRNAMIPTTTVIGVLLGALFSGTIVIETIFSWPGIGYYATQAIANFDFPAEVGVIVLFTIGVVVANLIADILYAVIDPRITV